MLSRQVRRAQDIITLNLAFVRLSMSSKWEGAERNIKFDFITIYLNLKVKNICFKFFLCTSLKIVKYKYFMCTFLRQFFIAWKNHKIKSMLKKKINLEKLNNFMNKNVSTIHKTFSTCISKKYLRNFSVFWIDFDVNYENIEQKK